MNILHLHTLFFFFIFETFLENYDTFLLLNTESQNSLVQLRPCRNPLIHHQKI